MPPPRGWKFGIGLEADGVLVGVGIAGRPVARMLDDGFTLEVTRIATNGHENACSKLYGSLRRIAKEMGYRRCVTYILATEPGTSLRAAGWKCLGDAGGGSWSRRMRQRESENVGLKTRWDAIL